MSQTTFFTEDNEQKSGDAHKSSSRFSGFMVPREFEGMQILNFLYRGRQCWIAGNIGSVMGYTKASRFAEKFQKEWKEDAIQGEDFEVLRGRDLNDFKDLVYVSTVSVVPSLSQSLLHTSQLVILYESGVHLALLKTRKPAGRRLRRFLAGEVMPQLRRDGRYSPERNINDDEIRPEVEAHEDASPRWRSRAVALQWLYNELAMIGDDISRKRVAMAMVELQTGLDLGSSAVLPSIYQFPIVTTDDKLDRFLRECCIFDEERWIAFFVLYNVFKRWCREQGYVPPNNVHFGQAINRRGFSRQRRSDVRGVVGIALA